MTLNIAYSPDADDAFMFWALETGKLSCDLDLNFTQLDTESLNKAALESRFDICAVSVGCLPAIIKNYRLLPHGGSVGNNYGPVIVANNPKNKESWQQGPIAIPGKHTTAALVLKLFYPKIQTIEVPISPFSEGFDCLSDGRAKASLLIHEGRLTYEKEGCFLLEDIGKTWYQKTKLPLPLGGNVIRRQMDQDLQFKLSDLLSESIRYALDHQDEAIADLVKHQLGNLRTHQEIKDYLNLYANEDTAAWSSVCYQAIQELLQQATQDGLMGPIDNQEINGSYWQANPKQRQA